MSDNEFGVGTSIARQDVCVMIYNTTDKNIALDNEKFTDHISVAIYASIAVYAMKALGIVNGYENGKFKPMGNLTRAEASKVI